MIYQHARRPEEAERCFREALRVSPDFIDAVNNLGAVLRDLGQIDAAAEVCCHGLELAPQDGDMHANLAPLPRTAAISKRRWPNMAEVSN